METVTLPARIVDPLHFVFCPDTWAEELKPISRAKWTHTSNKGMNLPPDFYELKSGDFLAFPQFNMTNGGFYAAHLYMVVKELKDVCKQVRATLTVEGLTLETVEGEVKTRVTLKPRGMSHDSTPHHAILQ